MSRIYEVTPFTIETAETVSNVLESEVRDADSLVLTFPAAIAEDLTLEFWDGTGWFEHVDALPSPDEGTYAQITATGLKYRLVADTEVAATRTIRVMKKVGT